MKFLIFGDVVGKPGREAINQALPKLREEYQPDSVIINIENMAHGSALSPETIKVALAWQADVYTTGDHAWDNKKGIPFLENKSLPIIRPANYPVATPGRGYHLYSVGAYEVAVIHLQGQVFFRNHPSNPFYALDELLQRPDIKRAAIKLVDFHAEATSEKRGLGWHADGHVTAIWGTHTHIPTADAQILPAGTGYISDIGMNGNHHSIIGVDKSGPLKGFLTQTKMSHSYEDDGPLEIGCLLLEVDVKSGRTTNIAHIRKILNDTNKSSIKSSNNT